MTTQPIPLVRTDGRTPLYNGKVYADTGAVREAAGIPPDTVAYFIRWNFDMNPDEK